MPGTNLTREEAQERAAILTVHTYDIDLELEKSTTRFRSSTTITFSCSDPGASTFADLVDAEVHAITLNGTELDPSTAYADSRIQLTSLAADNTLTVVADCAYSRTGEGLHRFVDPADDRIYTYTQFEVPDARRVYTSFEQPDLKAVFNFTVTAPESWVVVSNAATPTSEPAGDGFATWRFPTTETMSTYITALVAGEYYAVFDEYQGKHHTIPLGHFCRQSLKEHLDDEELVKVTKQGFEFFEATFDYPYPFGKYDQLYVPEYNMGAMENAGCVTFRDEYLPRSRQTHTFYEQRANTVLHEMAHMWFGDLVTMKWWDDLWLNESFAEWASHHAMTEATEYTAAWTGFTNARKNWAYRQDQLPSTHPIAADNYDLEAVEVNFDGITYAKGASTLKQLVAWVGIDPFITGLRSYFVEHEFSNSEFTDLLSALEQSSGRELDDWAEEWLQTAGVNTLYPEVTTDNDTITEFVVRQTAMAEFPTLRRHHLGIGLYDVVDGALSLRRRVNVDIDGERTSIAELVGEKPADLVLLNDGDLTYAKIRLDEKSLATAVQYLHTLDDSLARALLWGATWDMTRDAEMSATQFIDLVLNGIGAESDVTAVGRLPLYAGTAIGYYAAERNQATLRATWETGVRRLLDDAEPGSDHQLAFLRAYAAAARSEEGLDHVRAVLDGEVTYVGLTIDADLRWALVHSLAAGGRIDEAAITAERDSDGTIGGQEKAAAALAARPTPEAKAQAWEQAVVRDDVANETQRSVAGAFSRADQAEVLQPYLEKYLAAAETIWEDKGNQRASTVLTMMAPLPLVSAQTVARIKEWLDNSAANPASKRYVSEGLADMERALAARECDARG